MDILNDLSIMQYGLHKGKPLKAVPDHYLFWLYEEFVSKGTEGYFAEFNKALKAYISDNLDSINPAKKR